MVKKSGAKVGKKIVSLVTDSSFRRKSYPIARVMESETAYFFGREIYFAGKFLPRKLEIVKNFGLKFCRLNFFPV